MNSRMNYCNYTNGCGNSQKPENEFAEALMDQGEPDDT